jgi:toxin ParE1/3/4
MAKLEFSNASESDLENIDEYSLSHFGDDVAETYMLGFRDVFSLLQRHPLVGSEKPDLGRVVRCLVHRKHRIFYTFANDKVFIIRIIHLAQDARHALS